jgi:hypothetical protein
VRSCPSLMVNGRVATVAVVSAVRFSTKDLLPV